MAATDYTDVVQGIYIAYYGRFADQGGLAYWSGRLDQVSGNLDEIINYFGDSSEAMNLFGNMTSSDKINFIYNTLFNRDADSGGLAYYANLLDTHQASAADIAKRIADGAQGIDLIAIKNKISAANSLTASVSATAYSGDAAAAAGRTLIKEVTDTVAMPVHSFDQVLSTGGLAEGKSYTLTTSLDTINGTTSDDTITGYVNYNNGSTASTASTLTAIDHITGGTGNDTLSITVDGVLNNSGASVSLPGADIAGIEVLNIRNLATSNAAADLLTVDASLFAGLTAIHADRATQQLVVTNLSTDQTVGVIGNNSSTNGTLVANYKTSANSALVTVQDGTVSGAITLAGAGLTSTTVQSSGVANTIGALTLASTTTSLIIEANTGLTTGAITNTTAPALANISVSGAGAVNLSQSALQSSVTSIDATQNSGGVTLALGTGITSFKAGNGNDVITTAAVNTSAAGAVDGGSGKNTLVLASVSDVDTSAKGAIYTNFHTLNNATGNSVDVSLLAGITSEQVSGNGSSLSGLTAAQASAITVQGNTSGSTFALLNATGSADVLGVTLQNPAGSSDATPISLSAVTVDGFETMNLAVNSGIQSTLNSVSATGADQLSFNSANSLKNLNVSGSYDLGLNLSFGATALRNLDASAMTGTAGLGVTLGANANTLNVIGSSNGDFIALDSGIVSVNGGAGNDTVSGTAARIAQDTLVGGSGVDTLSMSSVGTLADNTFAYVTAFDKLTITDSTSVNLTSGGFFNTAFANGVTLTASALGAVDASFNLTTYHQNAELNLTSLASTQDINITGGAGVNSINVVANSLTSGSLTIHAGTGGSDIHVTDTHAATGASAPVVTVYADEGVDHISLAVSDTSVATAYSEVVIGSGSSSTGTYDTVTGFYIGAGAARYSDILTFDGSASVHSGISTTAVAGYTSAQLAFAVDAYGIVTFSGSVWSNLTTAQKDALMISSYNSSISNQLNAHNVVAFDDGENTFVFQHRSDGDSVVKLVGVTGVTHLTTSSVATDHYLTIA